MSNNSSPTDDVARLKAHIIALENELVRYAVKFGVTDEVRRLLAKSAS